MQNFTKLLGPTLLTASTRKPTPTSSLLQGKQFVCLYFSAHWCPPCRGFTPRLASLFRESAKANNIEVVFISSDQDKGAFEKYHDEMPWLALPFSDRETKAKLSQKYDVTGIPTLIVLDGSTGEVVTKQGRAKAATYFGPQYAVATPEATSSGSSDEDENPFESIFGDTLLTKGGEKSTAEVVSGKRFVGVYFSAHWCPPCRAFTPQLAELYLKRGSDIEVVFVSSDRDDASFRSYYDEQPWASLPFGRRDVKAALSEKFGVRGIPTLVVLDGRTGKLVTVDGRSQVAKYFTGGPKARRRGSRSASCAVM